LSDPNNPHWGQKTQPKFPFGGKTPSTQSDTVSPAAVSGGFAANRLLGNTNKH